jgi:choline dehydrogenase-like flavoprotein
MIRNLQEGPNTVTVQETTFTLDNMGRFLCNTLQEAQDSSAIQVAGKTRSFDTIVIGGGTFGAAIAASLLFADSTHSRRILVLEAGPFALPEHNQNMPYQGGTPDFRRPWDSHPALAYQGLLFAIGGRSLAWGGWSPQMLAAEINSWPASVAADLVNTYFRISSDQIGATDSNDFIFGRLHDALREQLFQAMKTPANVPGAIPLAALPDHPAVRYFSQSATLAAAAGAAGGTVTTVPAPPTPPDSQLREWLGLDATDTTPRADLLNLLKLEAPLAVQARTAPGEFPSNKYSAVPTLTKAARIASAETGGVGTEADARKRLMVVPKCHVLDIITETQSDNWVRATGVRVKDATGAEQVLSLTPPTADGHQGSVIIALGTIESTRLALSTFKDSLSGRAAQRMGTNLVAHLRSNLTIRIPIEALSFLAPSDRKSLEVSALFVKGKATINGVDHFCHLQITASGLGKLGDNSEAELFQKVPDIEHLEGLLNTTDTHVVITVRGIGEMTTHNPDSFVRLSSTVTDFGRPAAEVTMADVRDGSSTTPQSEIDKKMWDAMDALADQVAAAFANKQPFDILANDGTTINMPVNTTAAQVKAAYPYAGRRDRLGTTHHDAGTLFMGTNPATSVTNEFGRIHDTTNCYVASPAIFPALGSPNPMLTGIALAHRTSDMLTADVLPRAVARVTDPGFTALFNGTANTFNSWKSADAKNGQGFALIDGEIVTYGSADFALLYLANKAFANFHLRLQFKCFDPNNNNSGVFVRARDPRLRLPAELASRADADKASGNPAWSAVISGFEVQIDDNARGDVNKDFYGRKPEPDGLWKNRTGAIYKIPAGDFIYHLGRYDDRLQQFTPGPPLVPGVWFQYDIAVTGNHYEVTLTNTQSGASQVTTVFDNPDTARGIAQLNGHPAGFIGIQSYPSSPMAFRDIWIK